MSGQIDYRARLLFLRAAERIWEPSPLSALQRLAGPAIREWLSSDRLFGVKFDFESQESLEIEKQLFLFGITGELHSYNWERLCGDTSDSAARAAHQLREWGGGYRIGTKNAWVFDAALQTAVYAAARGLETLQWAYQPAEDLRPPFRLPALWWESDESHSHFRRRAKVLFENEIKAHSSRIRANEGQRSEQDEEAATWVAQVFAGRTRKSIASGLMQGKDPENRVIQAVGRFARRAGLKLPPARV